MHSSDGGNAGYRKTQRTSKIPNCPKKNKTDPKRRLQYKQKFPAKLSSLNKTSKECGPGWDLNFQPLAFLPHLLTTRVAANRHWLHDHASQEFYSLFSYLLTLFFFPLTFFFFLPKVLSLAYYHPSSHYPFWGSL